MAMLEVIDSQSKACSLERSHFTMHILLCAHKQCSTIHSAGFAFSGNFFHFTITFFEISQPANLCLRALKDLCLAVFLAVLIRELL